MFYKKYFRSRNSDSKKSGRRPLNRKKRIRVKASKINTIELKVEHLDTSISGIKHSFGEFQKSQEKMESAQSTTMTKFLPITISTSPTNNNFISSNKSTCHQSQSRPGQPPSTTDITTTFKNPVERLNTRNQKKNSK